MSMRSAKTEGAFSASASGELPAVQSPLDLIAMGALALRWITIRIGVPRSPGPW